MNHVWFKPMLENKCRRVSGLDQKPHTCSESVVNEDFFREIHPALYNLYYHLTWLCNMKPNRYLLHEVHDQTYACFQLNLNSVYFVSITCEHFYCFTWQMCFKSRTERGRRLCGLPKFKPR